MQSYTVATYLARLTCIVPDPPGRAAIGGRQSTHWYRPRLNLGGLPRPRDLMVGSVRWRATSSAHSDGHRRDWAIASTPDVLARDHVIVAIQRSSSSSSVDSSSPSPRSCLPVVTTPASSLLIAGHASKALPEVPLSLTTALLFLSTSPRPPLLLPSHPHSYPSHLHHLHPTTHQTPSTTLSSHHHKHTSKLHPRHHPLHSICQHS